MHKLLNDNCFKVLLKYALDHDFQDELFELIYLNPVLFDFAGLAVDAESEDAIFKAIRDHNTKHKGESYYDEVQRIVTDHQIIQSVLKSYMYANENYGKFDKKDVMLYYRNEITHVDIITEYMNESVYYNIIYFYNKVLLHLIEDSKIDFYKKIITTSYQRIDN